MEQSNKAELNESTYVVLYVFTFMIPVLGIGFAVWRAVKEDTKHACFLFVAAISSFLFWALIPF